MEAIAVGRLEVQLQRRAVARLLKSRLQLSAALCDTQFLPEAECRSP